ncbi:MAG: TraR/DksA C4-type zinc finger protein [Candidatus Pacebacteria bacterium]|nr:TraR/DksA C4-type zinc finger protein [Candidatus Paceibacterota bacterium]
MNQETLTQLKKDLEIKKLEIEKELAGIAEKGIGGDNWNTKYPNNTTEHDLEDEANEVEEYENLLPVEYVLEEKLKNINLALQKLSVGTFGLCENCRKEISEERLKIFPEARTCNDCSATQ